MLLIDYLQKSAEELLEMQNRQKKLEIELQRIGDPELRRDIGKIRSAIFKKMAEIKEEVLTRLDEFRCIKKYFPEVYNSLIEDETVGPTLKQRSWLLDFKEINPQDAVRMIMDLKNQRAQLKEVKNQIQITYGKLNTQKLLTTYPVLRAYITSSTTKEEILDLMEELNKKILRAGWLLLLTRSLIKIPLAKYVDKIRRLHSEKLRVNREYLKLKGRGAVIEFEKLREAERLNKKIVHYERVIRQILLANPEYLRSLKKTHWLAKDKETLLQKISKEVTPKSVHEQKWLSEMQERIETL